VKNLSNVCNGKILPAIIFLVLLFSYKKSSSECSLSRHRKVFHKTAKFLGINQCSSTLHEGEGGKMSTLASGLFIPSD
jgi:hypothetical protein